MDVDDIILWLVPHASGLGWEHAAYVVNHPENKHLLHIGSVKHPEPELQHGERLTLPPDEAPSLETTNSLVLRFSDLVRNPDGIVFGSGPRCDVLVDHHGVSQKHLKVTFNDQNLPVIRDLNSRFGTKVVYPGNEITWAATAKEGFIRDSEWILRGPCALNEVKESHDRAPVVYFAWNLVFQVRLPPGRDYEDSAYVARVNAFRARNKDPTDLFGELAMFNSNATRPATGQATPRQNKKLLYYETAGAGAFGQVRYVWNSRTGEEFAYKKSLLSEQALRMWLSEVEILKRLQHANIVHYKTVIQDPEPTLVMEWLRGQPLSIARPKTDKATVEVLIQLCSALDYLQSQKNPIAHRDIKPDNIMVMQSPSGELLVKLIDFGMAKRAFNDPLETFCGTGSYLAPEVYNECPSYGVRVYIWSTGMVVLWALCDLPVFDSRHLHERYRGVWVEEVLDHIDYHRSQDEFPHRLFDLLTDNMLIHDPAERSTADYCLDAAQLLFATMTTAIILPWQSRNKRINSKLSTPSMSTAQDAFPSLAPAPSNIAPLDHSSQDVKALLPTTEKGLSASLVEHHHPDLDKRGDKRSLNRTHTSLGTHPESSFNELISRSKKRDRT